MLSSSTRLRRHLPSLPQIQIISLFFMTHFTRQMSEKNKDDCHFDVSRCKSDTACARSHVLSDHLRRIIAEMNREGVGKIRRGLQAQHPFCQKIQKKTQIPTSFGARVTHACGIFCRSSASCRQDTPGNPRSHRRKGCFRCDVVCSPVPWFLKRQSSVARYRHCPLAHGLSFPRALSECSVGDDSHAHLTCGARALFV
ncbi:MAG: hypothetical protein KatS3mg113_1096 [Planctomycetaceae bacterium]|nr:MAG: hypothetical protein KatS3mg113_1096 [Planctomycetaceae bacterium]